MTTKMSEASWSWPVLTPILATAEEKQLLAALAKPPSSTPPNAPRWCALRSECHATNCDRREKRLGEFKRCARCRNAVYCSVGCQRGHWVRTRLRRRSESLLGSSFDKWTFMNRFPSNVDMKPPQRTWSPKFCRNFESVDMSHHTRRKRVAKCIVCFEQRIISSWSSYCGHRVCHECLRRHVNTSINDLPWHAIHCPEYDCGREFTRRELLQFAAPDEIKRYDAARRIHPTRTRSTQTSSEPMDVAFEAYVRRQGRAMQRCPRCHSVVERVDGCDHMTCRCGEDFCFQCGAKEYWQCNHFPQLEPDNGGRRPRDPTPNPFLSMLIVLAFMALVYFVMLSPCKRTCLLRNGWNGKTVICKAACDRDIELSLPVSVATSEMRCLDPKSKSSINICQSSEIRP